MNNVFLVVAVVVIAFLIFNFTTMGGDEKLEREQKGLGKAKEKGKTTQQTINFENPPQESKTKLQAVREIVRARVNHESALTRLKNDPNNARYKELADQYHKEATKKESFLKTNYSTLKGASYKQLM
jgi:hypothetical protein